jgi:NOL1/NOP2/fmu family ribosome biogenesis protein
MAFISGKEKKFQSFIERHFEIKLPKDILIFYSEGIRIGSKSLLGENIKGEMGYAAADGGFNPTLAFITNFGHLAKRNVVVVDEESAKKFASGESLDMDIGTSSKYVIIRLKTHTIGLGHYDHKKKKIINKIPQKTARKIVNSIKIDNPSTKANG